jgi:addiction module RelB/DinJ family antitoxin
MATIQLRIDNATKKSAKSILDKLGIDMTAAIKIYLKQIVINKGIPFQLLTENGLTIQQEDQILKAEKEAEKGINLTDSISPE